MSSRAVWASVALLLFFSLPAGAQTLGPEHALDPNAHHPRDHADTHRKGGQDELRVETLATSCPAGHIVQSDGAGGLYCDPDDGTVVNAQYVIGVPDVNLANAKVLGSDVIMSGLMANRPAPQLAGRLYFAVDSGALFRDTGSMWTTIIPELWPLSRGGLGASVAPDPGALLYSSGSGLLLGPVGVSGQFLRSGGTGAYSWYDLFGSSNTWTGIQTLLSSEPTIVLTESDSLGRTARILVNDDTFRLVDGTSAVFLSKLLSGSGTAVLALNPSGGEVTINGYTAWHAGNDGVGSGLDADRLDGQSGEYYRDAANLTGTLPDARLSTNVPLKNASNVWTQPQVHQQQIVVDTGGGPDLILGEEKVVRNANDTPTSVVMTNEGADTGASGTPDFRLSVRAGSGQGASSAVFDVQRPSGEVALEVTAGGAVRAYRTHSSTTPQIEVVDNSVAPGSRMLQIGDDVFFTDLDEANTVGLYGVQNSAFARLRLGNTGACIEGDAGHIRANGYVVRHAANAVAVAKTTTTSISNSTVLTDDPELGFAVEPNSAYTFDFTVFYTSGSVADIKFSFSVPSGSSGRVLFFGLRLAASSQVDVGMEPRDTIVGDGEAVAAGGLGESTTTTAQISGTVFTGSSAGNVRLRWAQNSATSATTQVLRGSHVKAMKVL